MKELLLGIFSNRYYDAMRAERKWIGFYSLGYWGVNTYDTSISAVINKACNIATTINFLLDGIKVPVQSKYSATCEELEVILHNKEFLGKTVFWLGGKMVDKEVVVKCISKYNEIRDKLVHIETII